jgi:hypothetical protein
MCISPITRQSKWTFEEGTLTRLRLRADLRPSRDVVSYLNEYEMMRSTTSRSAALTPKCLILISSRMNLAGNS